MKKPKKKIRAKKPKIPCPYCGEIIKTRANGTSKGKWLRECMVPECPTRFYRVCPITLKASVLNNGHRGPVKHVINDAFLADIVASKQVQDEKKRKKMASARLKLSQKKKKIPSSVRSKRSQKKQKKQTKQTKQTKQKKQETQTAVTLPSPAKKQKKQKKQETQTVTLLASAPQKKKKKTIIETLPLELPMRLPAMAPALKATMLAEIDDLLMDSESDSDE